MLSNMQRDLTGLRRRDREMVNYNAPEVTARDRIELRNGNRLREMISKTIDDLSVANGVPIDKLQLTDDIIRAVTRRVCETYSVQGVTRNTIEDVFAHMKAQS
jgi:hypothetical protein